MQSDGKKGDGSAVTRLNKGTIPHCLLLLLPQMCHELRFAGAPAPRDNYFRDKDFEDVSLNRLPSLVVVEYPFERRTKWEDKFRRFEGSTTEIAAATIQIFTRASRAHFLHRPISHRA